MRFRLVEIKGYRLAVACESISGNPAVHNFSADDYRLAGVVFCLGAGYAGRRRSFEQQQEAKGPQCTLSR